MNRFTKVAVSALFVATMAACGDGGGGNGGESGGAATGNSDACLAEIKRQMATDQQTDDVPPACKGLSDERLAELGKIAIADGFLGSPSPR